jgi:hypothetical protein
LLEDEQNSNRVFDLVVRDVDNESSAQVVKHLPQQLLHRHGRSALDQHLTKGDATRAGPCSAARVGDNARMQCKHVCVRACPCVCAFVCACTNTMGVRCIRRVCVVVRDGRGVDHVRPRISLRCNDGVWEAPCSFAVTVSLFPP